MTDLSFEMDKIHNYGKEVRSRIAARHEMMNKEINEALSRINSPVAEDVETENSKKLDDMMAELDSLLS